MQFGADIFHIFNHPNFTEPRRGDMQFGVTRVRELRRRVIDNDNSAEVPQNPTLTVGSRVGGTIAGCGWNANRSGTSRSPVTSLGLPSNS